MEDKGMKRFGGGFFALTLLCFAAQGQGVISDVFSGSLVNPKVGAWAWYEINGGAAPDGGIVRLGTMRLAIVGEEKVGDKQGYWLEMEYVPSVGYPSVYKMLLTGPAKDPANVHKMFLREGIEKKQEVSLKSEGQDKKGKADPPKGKKDDTAAVTPPEPATEPNRKLVDETDITTASGVVHAQHYEVSGGDGKMDIWLNESVCPMGIVKMKSAEGSLLLREYGAGGPGARSVIDDPPPTAGKDAKGGVKVDVRVEKEPKPAPPPQPSKGKPK
jgi:hypothetical protein